MSYDPTKTFRSFSTEITVCHRPGDVLTMDNEASELSVSNSWMPDECMFAEMAEMREGGSHSSHGHS